MRSHMACGEKRAVPCSLLVLFVVSVFGVRIVHVSVVAGGVILLEKRSRPTRPSGISRGGLFLGLDNGNVAVLLLYGIMSPIFTKKSGPCRVSHWKNFSSIVFPCFLFRACDFDLMAPG